MGGGRHEDRREHGGGHQHRPCRPSASRRASPAELHHVVLVAAPWPTGGRSVAAAHGPIICRKAAGGIPVSPASRPAPGTAIVTGKGLSGEDTEEFFASPELGLTLIRPARNWQIGAPVKRSLIASAASEETQFS